MSAARLLHRDANATSLAIARIAVFGMWAWHLANARLRDLAALPLDLLEPVGVLRLLPASACALLFSDPVLLGLQALAAACAAALALGAGPFRPLAALTCVLLVVEQSLMRSVGFITHGEVPMLLAAIVLAAFPCDDALAFGRTRERDRLPHRTSALYRAPLVACGLVLCLTYALTAARRFDAGGLAIFFDGTILYRVALRAAERHGLGLIVIERPWLGHLIAIGFPIVTLAELLSPLALFHRGFRWAWIAVLVLFHLTVSWLMTISFRANLVLIAVFLTELPQLAGLWAAKRRRT